MEAALRHQPPALRLAYPRCVNHNAEELPLTQQLHHWDEQIEHYDRQLEALAAQREPSQRLMQINGIGPITATALVASVGDARVFKNGRQFAAWLGLTPRQYSSGGVTRLGRITKRGDRYLRMLLVHGARALLRFVNRKTDAKSTWAKALKERRHVNIAAVALAAKHARIIWAMLARGTAYRQPQKPDGSGLSHGGTRLIGGTQTRTA